MFEISKKDAKHYKYRSENLSESYAVKLNVVKPPNYEICSHDFVPKVFLINLPNALPVVTNWDSLLLYMAFLGLSEFV